MIEKINALFLKDGYKVDHRSQYPANVDIYNNFCPRSSRSGEVDHIIFVGTQYLILEYLIDRWNRTFFNRPEDLVVLEYKRIIDNYIGRGKITYDHIRNLHNLGYLPIKIKALPEGTRVPMGVPVMTCINTVKGYGWLAQMLETLISNVMWPISTSATTAYEFRKAFEKHAIKTGYDRSFVKWQGHDFSFRGMFELEAALVSGFAHLCSFFGTDTIPAIPFAEMFYGADVDKELVGGTVPATEHSVMSIGIKKGGEFELLKRLLTQVYPEGILSVVLDTEDFWKNIQVHVRDLKEIIISREGRFVSRPDSGDPVRIICGYREDEIIRENRKIYVKGSRITGDEYSFDTFLKGKELSEIEVIGAWEALWNIFGGTISDTGYKLLDTHIGLIYGDAINRKRQDEILLRLEQKGFAFNNGVLGLGSFSYQFTTRDVYRWAIKATAAIIDSEIIELSKNPLTDNTSFKKSACGFLQVYGENGELKLKDHCTLEEEKNGLLKVVFLNSKLTKTTSLSEIREKIDNNLQKELINNGRT